MTTLAIGIVHGREIEPEFRRCLGQVMVRDALMFPGRIIGEYDQYSSGAHVATGRCGVVTSFLKSPFKPEWLLFLDTDATFADDIVDQMLSMADPTKAPIVGALAFGVSPETDENGNIKTNAVGATKSTLYPTMYRFAKSGMNQRLLNWTRDTMVEVDGTGCHCLLIHRSVLEDKRWDTRHPLPWFRSGTVIDNGGDKVGEVSEDMFFCIKARGMGYPIYVNTAAKTGHVRYFIADEDMFIELQKNAAKVQGTGTQKLEADIIVFAKTRSQPKLAHEFVKLWQANKEGSEIVFCLDDDDPKMDEYPKVPGVHAVSGPTGWDHTPLMVMTARQARVKAIANLSMAFSFSAGWSKRRDHRIMDPEKILAVYDKRRRRMVLIPSRDAVKCKAIVESLLTQNGHDRIIVAWNGADQAFEQWLSDQPKVATLLCESEVGIHKMWNYAITSGVDSDADIVFLNDDVEIGERFVERLVSGLYSYPKIAATCPNYDGRLMTENALVTDICAGRYDGSGGLSGFAFALSREWLDATKYTFPEECKWYYGDNDLIMSIYQSLWAALMVANVTCKHDEDHSTWETPEMMEITNRDREAFLRKWPQLSMTMEDV